jgi:hypothetical protein
MTDIELIRHTLATLAYRAAKTMRGAPASFGNYQAAPNANMPVRIVSHMGDLFDWALTLVQGDPKWNGSVPKSWDEECSRFFSTLKRFDDWLATGIPIHYDLRRLFQGPIADALTHTGQLAMLRRLHGSPMRGESYTRADIETGRVGSDQAAPDPKNEFD